MSLNLTNALAAPSSTTNSNTKQSIKLIENLYNNEVTSSSTTARKDVSSTTTQLKSNLVLPTNAVADAAHNPVFAAPGMRWRKRHSKRHSNFHDNFNFDEKSSALEWANPCDGVYVASYEQFGRGSGAARRRHLKQEYNFLRNSAASEFKTLNNNQHKQHIDIRNINAWSLRDKFYKFLPKLKKNSTKIPLKRWYRNMQTYVASFAYLRRTQYKWDMANHRREDNISLELRNLLSSSRHMLCALETAVNNTLPFHVRRQLQLQNINATREQMNKRLKLKTKKCAEQSKHPNEPMEADRIDLMFVKYYYYEFLETMWKALRKSTKRRGQIALSFSESKGFNEVEKNFGSVSRAQKGQNTKRTKPNNNKKSMQRERQQRTHGLTYATMET